MTLMKSKYVLCLILVGVVSYCYSCAHEKDKVACELDEIVGCQVQMPDDTLFQNGKAKILVLVEDTGDCSPCSMGINEWYVYRLDMEDRDLKADVVFVFPELMRLPLEVNAVLSQYGLCKFYGYEKFMEANPFLKQTTYSTFLVSPERKVEVAGSPLDFPKLWSVYRKALECTRE